MTNMPKLTTKANNFSSANITDVTCGITLRPSNINLCHFKILSLPLKSSVLCVNNYGLFYCNNRTMTF